MGWGDVIIKSLPVISSAIGFLNKKEDTRQVEIVEDGESKRAEEERKIAEVEEKRKGIEAEENRKIKEAKENRKIKEAEENRKKLEEIRRIKEVEENRRVKEVEEERKKLEEIRKEKEVEENRKVKEAEEERKKHEIEKSSLLIENIVKSNNNLVSNSMKEITNVGKDALELLRNENRELYSQIKYLNEQQKISSNDKEKLLFLLINEKGKPFYLDKLRNKIEDIQQKYFKLEKKASYNVGKLDELIKSLERYHNNFIQQVKIINILSQEGNYNRIYIELDRLKDIEKEIIDIEFNILIAERERMKSKKILSNKEMNLSEYKEKYNKELYNSSFSYFNESKPHINMEGSDITLVENKYSK